MTTKATCFCGNADCDCLCDATIDDDVGYRLSGLGMVAAFYYEKRGRMPTPDEARALLVEELAELSQAFATEGPLAQLKELADVLYTAYGYALSRDWNLAEAFRLVHESNMTKERTTSGKIQKGDAYVPPDLRGCV